MLEKEVVSYKKGKDTITMVRDGQWIERTDGRSGPAVDNESVPWTRI